MASLNGQSLTKPQADLWAEIQKSDTGGLWIRDCSRWSRTVRVLHRLGLVRVADRDRVTAFYVPASQEPPT